jgi:hypothetical protein
VQNELIDEDLAAAAKVSRHAPVLKRLVGSD